MARRFAGTDAKGELGFRFGEPLDVDGDGHADVAAGARFKLQQGVLQSGSATIWSGASGRAIRSWDGSASDGLFGHWVLLVPDVSGDGLADVIIAAPHELVDGRMRGMVVARSPKTGNEIWKRAETESENYGWDMALAGDQNGDRYPDVFVGAPAQDSGRVDLLNGRDGTVLRSYTPPEESGSFGWFVATVDDLDGDGHADLAGGAPYAAGADGDRVGTVWIVSSASGRPLRHLRGTDHRGAYGSVIAGLGDLDGDRKGEIAVAAPATEDQTRSLPGELWIYSGATGKELRHWTGTQPGELFGRMVVDAGDLDGDHVDDIAIGAPWFRRDAGDRTGRVEFRSGRTGKVLGELVGDEPECWFGWHIRRAPDPDGRKRPALLIASLRHSVGGLPSVGVLDLYVLRTAAAAKSHGTIKRGARRRDIR